MKLDKPCSTKEYAEFAAACNAAGLIIEDKGDFYEGKPQPEKTIEQKQFEVRQVRNDYLSDTDKYMIVDFPVSDDERDLYKIYRQYLRDYTKLPEWWESYPKTFEDWKE